MTQRRCTHSDAYERSDLRENPVDRVDDSPTHWYCPDCDSYFPLIGDTDHWIKYLPETDSDSQTLPTKT